MMSKTYKIISLFSIPYWYYIVIFFLVGPSLNIQAQVTPQGFPYQGMAFNQKGDILADAHLFLKVILTAGPDPVDALFTEVHQIQTSKEGRYDLVIGQGYDQENELSDVPWETNEIWLHTSWIDKSGNPFRWESSTQLFAVPYALFAEKAGNLAPSMDATLRTDPGPSIYWLTSGNYGTRPPVHYLGNTDNRDIVFKTNNVERARISNSGQTKISAKAIELTNDEKLESSYPLVVKGKEQGIWIKINDTGTRKNNFITFTDNTGTIHGRVEAQITSEWYDDWKTKLKITQIDFTLAAIITQEVALGIQLALFGTPSGPAASGIVLSIADLALVIAGLIVDEKFFYDYNLSNMGVNYDSGGADFGEWLPKADSFIHRPGLIVGEFDGTVSMRTDNANSCKVLTNQSAVLGNMPQSGRGSKYVPVALLGQVPVRIVGPVDAGDIIIPTGNNDGLGRAVKLNQLAWEDYPKIVGISWENSNHQLIHTVNVAVGLQGNALAQKMDSLNQRLDVVLAYLLEGDRSTPLNLQEEKSKLSSDTSATSIHPYLSGIDEDAFDRFLENQRSSMEIFFEAIYQNMSDRGIESKRLEHFYQFSIDPIKALRDMRNDPSLQSIWPYFDAFISRNKSRYDD
ncbi:MAG: hypothetical protein HRU40_19300 [Saprospiraceae bacterium]|nr:hypothetical protein [Saprospiraceae bacterium]